MFTFGYRLGYFLGFCFEANLFGKVGKLLNFYCFLSCKFCSVIIVVSSSCSGKLHVQILNQLQCIRQIKNLLSKILCYEFCPVTELRCIPVLAYGITHLIILHEFQLCQNEMHMGQIKYNLNFFPSKIKRQKSDFPVKFFMNSIHLAWWLSFFCCCLKGDNCVSLILDTGWSSCEIFTMRISRPAHQRPNRISSNVQQAVGRHKTTLTSLTSFPPGQVLDVVLSPASHFCSSASSLALLVWSYFLFCIARVDIIIYEQLLVICM